MRFRAPTIDDAPAVLEVLVARDIADLGLPDYVLEDLLDEWRATGLDLSVDARVVEFDGRTALRTNLRLRSLDVENDAVAVHPLDAASFAGAPDYRTGQKSLQAFRGEHLGAHDLDPLRLLTRTRVLGCGQRATRNSAP